MLQEAAAVAAVEGAEDHTQVRAVVPGLTGMPQLLASQLRDLQQRSRYHV